MGIVAWISSCARSGDKLWTLYNKCKDAWRHSGEALLTLLLFQLQKIDTEPHIIRNHSWVFVKCLIGMSLLDTAQLLSQKTALRALTGKSAR